jgi:hypothetical protein
MTVRLQKKLAALRDLVPQLNSTTNDVGRIGQAVETMLSSELRIGITAETDPFDILDHVDDEGRSLRTSSMLAYGRISEKYRLLVVTQTRVTTRAKVEVDDAKDGDLLAKTETPWSSSPREVKFHSFEKLPALLERLADEAVRLNRSALKTVGAVRSLLSAMAPDGHEKRSGELDQEALRRPFAG